MNGVDPSLAALWVVGFVGACFKLADSWRSWRRENSDA